MDRSLMDIIKKYRGKIPQKYQKQIIRLIENLDKVRIFHGDPNPMNFMEKDGIQLEDKFIKKHIYAMKVMD